MENFTRFAEEIDINYALQSGAFSVEMAIEKMRKFEIAVEKPEIDIEFAAIIISQCVIDNYEGILDENLIYIGYG